MKTLRKTAEEAYLKYANKIINRETWIDGFINIKKNIHNLSSFAACCGTQRIWPSAVTRRTAIITTHGMKRWRSVGKRLPTWQEWVALCDLDSTWDDELKGRWFGGNHNSDHKGSLFLPAAGLRNVNSGELAFTSSLGYYWSSSPNYGSNNGAGNLGFSSGNVSPLNSYYRAYGFSVRCVQNK